MSIEEKIIILLRNMNLSAVAREAQISRSSIDKYLKGSVPSAAIAARISRVLGVDPGWLIDDRKGWPPKRIGKPKLILAA